MMLDAERSGLPFLYWRDGDQQLHFLMLAGDRSPLTVGRRETAGVPLPAVADRLGHSSISVTGDMYSHVRAELQANTADLGAALIFGTRVAAAGGAPGTSE